MSGEGQSGVGESGVVTRRQLLMQWDAARQLRARSDADAVGEGCGAAAGRQDRHPLLWQECEGGEGDGRAPAVEEKVGVAVVRECWDEELDGMQFDGLLA